MLVRKQKCISCGANKLVPNKTMYVYCDYCGSFMDYDMKSTWKDAFNAFAPENMNNPITKEYLANVTKLNDVIASKDKNSFIELQCKIHELEFDIFPNRFGPKGKQPAYRKKYMDYYKKMYEETVNDSYFEKAKSNQIDTSKLKYNVVDGKVHYELNQDFFDYIDANVDYINKQFEGNSKLESLKYHPEGEFVMNSDFMYKLSLCMFMQVFNNNEAEAIAKHLKLEDEFIEIPDVSIDKKNCIACNSEILVPEGASSIVCETCGTQNNIKTQSLKCLNCGGDYNPGENKACPFCGARIEIPDGLGELLSSKYKEAAEQKPKKKGFFSALFGKN
jgi:DNA-directed RNA polymerase subunit RPC12/RpoP